MSEATKRSLPERPARVVALYAGGECDACGDPIRVGETIMHDTNGATKRRIHSRCEPW